MRTRIKICGITDLDAAAAVVAAGADALGAVIVKSSPRCTTIEFAMQMQACVPPYVEVVPVYQDHEFAPDEMNWGFGGTVQLHGEVQRSSLPLPYRVVRALPFEVDSIREWDSVAEIGALLIDAHRPGSGDTFDHNALAELMPSVTKPVILAGGLTPENVGEAIRTVRPYAVDVSSGVESSPGVKDPELIHAFCEAVREADRALAAQM